MEVPVCIKTEPEETLPQTTDEAPPPEPPDDRRNIVKSEVDLGIFEWEEAGSEGGRGGQLSRIAGSAGGVEGMYQVGSKLEALDIATNKWFGVTVLEVDWDDREVLIHFEKWSQRFDEWIPMNSSRLRTPLQGGGGGEDAQNGTMSFQVGEMVMATWSDGRKYPATIRAELSGDSFEVLFYDGFSRTMKIHKLAKCSGVEGVAPTLPVAPMTMSKAERRERKRKISSVAELFHMKKPSKRAKDESDAGKRVKQTSLQAKQQQTSKTSKTSYTDLTASDNEGEKTYINLTQDEERGKGGKLPPPPAAQPPAVKRKRSYNKVFLDNSPAASPAVRAGKRYAEGVPSSEYDNWEPEGEEAYLVETSDGLRRSIVVEDDRLPAGWAKHTIQRRAGNSAGKWDVFLVSPCGRRFRSRKEMAVFFAEQGEAYRPELFDFTLRGLSKRPVCNMRLKAKETEHFKPHPTSADKKAKARKAPAAVAAVGSEASAPAPASTPAVEPPSEASLRRVKTLLPRARGEGPASPPPPPHRPCTVQQTTPPMQPPPPAAQHAELSALPPAPPPPADGASSGVQCPGAGCAKHFRNENLLQMHLKHYHPEYSQFMGATPNVADLAYARTVRAPVEDLLPAGGSFLDKINRFEATKKAQLEAASSPPPATVEAPADTTNKAVARPLEARRPSKPLGEERLLPRRELRVRLTDVAGARPPPRSPSDVPAPPPLATPPGGGGEGVSAATTPLRELLRKEPQHKVGNTGGIRTLLPIVRTTVKIPARDLPLADHREGLTSPPSTGSSSGGENRSRRKRRLSDGHHRKRNPTAKLHDAVDVLALPGSNIVSFLTPPSRQPFGKRKLPALQPFEMLEAVSPAPTPSAAPAAPLTEEQLHKRDIINCTCGVMEEDGLMIQCDLCLCWQHGYCNGIEKEAEVPDKYVCYICQHPLRERKSMKHLHNQDWLKEGVLPSLSGRSKDAAAVAQRSDLLRRSHDLTSTLLDVRGVVRGLRVKLNIANSKDHPKLYLWSKPWDKHTFDDLPPPDTVAKSTEPSLAAVKLEPVDPDASLAESSEGVKTEAQPCETVTGSTPHVPKEEEVVPTPEGGEVKDVPESTGAGLNADLASDAAAKPYVGGGMEGHILLQALTQGQGGGSHPPPPPPTEEELLQFPISRTELMHFAHSMAAGNLTATASEASKAAAPEPEKPIEGVECRLLLLDHIQHHQTQIRDKLQMLEDQITALEREDPDPLTEETLDFCPHTKQTLKMLLRDLTTMRSLSTLN